MCSSDEGVLLNSAETIPTTSPYLLRCASWTMSHDWTLQSAVSCHATASQSLRSLKIGTSKMLSQPHGPQYMFTTLCLSSSAVLSYELVPWGRALRPQVTPSFLKASVSTICLLVRSQSSKASRNQTFRTQCNVAHNFFPSKSHPKTSLTLHFSIYVSRV